MKKPTSGRGRGKILECKIINGQLVIKIGVDALVYAVTHGDGWWLAEDAPKHPQAIKITDADKFAQGICEALNYGAEEDGEKLHQALDWAANEAIESGCDGIEFPNEGRA